MRRPVLPGDIASAARALLHVPEAKRARLCACLFAGAARACAHLEQGMGLHPRWGDGTLSAAARRFPLADEPPLDDVEYLACTIRVLRAVHGRIG